MAYGTITVSNAKIKFRWEEPYVSEAHNVAFNALPAGVYRGFEPEADAPASDKIFLRTSTEHGDSFLVSRTGPVTGPRGMSAYKVAYRESADIEIQTVGLVPNTTDSAIIVYVVFVPDYTIGGGTSGEWRVLSEAEYLALSATTGLCAITGITIPAGATSILSWYIWSGTAAVDSPPDRPWHSDENDFSDMSTVMSPRYGFIDPYMNHQLRHIREWTLQQWYDGGYSGYSYGDATPPSGGGGRFIFKSSGGLNFRLVKSMAPGSPFEYNGRPGGYVVDGTTSPDWEMGFVSLSTMNATWAQGRIAPVAAFTLVDADEDAGHPERGHFPDVTMPVAFTGTNTIEIGPGTTNVFGDPVNSISDLTMGDMIEVTSNTGSTLFGWYLIKSIKTSAGKTVVDVWQPNGIGVDPEISWATYGVTPPNNGGYARVWRSDFIVLPTKKGTGGSVVGWTAMIRARYNSTGLALTGAPRSTPLRVWGCGGSSVSYQYYAFEANVTGDAMAYRNMCFGTMTRRSSSTRTQGYEIMGGETITLNLWRANFFRVNICTDPTIDGSPGAVVFDTSAPTTDEAVSPTHFDINQGHQFEVWFYNGVGTGGAPVVNSPSMWPASCVWSSESDKYLTPVDGAIDKYKAVRSTDSKWIMSVERYVP